MEKTGGAGPGGYRRKGASLNPMIKGTPAARTAFRFVLVMGIVNLFADMTYEGARSVTGAYLGFLGASATAVGFVAGFGEFIGYGIRLASGFFADRTRKYWSVVFAGYFINLFAVPALALAGSWPVAAMLIVAERAGRAVRKPAVEALLSDAGETLGQGWVFGLNEALDQTGATVGPLVVAYVLYRKGGYPHAFAVLLVSAILCLGTLVVARSVNPRGREGPGRAPALPSMARRPAPYWCFFAGGLLIAAGFADFSLIAFHLQRARVVADDIIPVFYSVAMATGALGSLALGPLLDRFGRPVLLTAFAVPVLFAPLVFLGGPAAALIGMILWGLGMAAQDSLLKAVLAGLVPRDGRATGFGLFDAGFGAAWFVGSAAMGWLYDRSIPLAIGFSMATQAAALPALYVAARSGRPRPAS
jgi:predicted MFS family arabinose efflux permease